jgi:hypothetical protein
VRRHLRKPSSASPIASSMSSGPDD